MVGNLSSEVDGKVDRRLEFGPFRDELETQLRALTAKLASLQRDVDDAGRQLTNNYDDADDDAAGTRRQLLQPANCLSCDKLVHMTPNRCVQAQV